MKEDSRVRLSFLSKSLSRNTHTPINYCTKRYISMMLIKGRGKDPMLSNLSFQDPARPCTGERKKSHRTSKVSRVVSAIPRTYHQETAEIDNTRSFSAHSGSGGLFQVKPARSERFSRRSKGSAPSMWRGNRQHGAAS